MIFVTVGSTAFLRLIKEMDKIAGEIDESVLMQIGFTKYSCKNAKCIQFSSYEDIVSYMQQARIIVCHDGVGTILAALPFDKPIVVVPRLKCFGETYFNNKGDVINALAATLKTEPVYDVDKLKSALENVDSEVKYVESDNHKNLVNTLSEYINQLHMQKVDTYRFRSK